MNWQGWAELALTIAVTVMIAVPLGAYLGRVWAGEKTWADPVLRPAERALHKALGVDPKQQQSWSAYALSLLAFSAAGFAALYALLRLQGALPLNPQGFGGLSPHLAFNTAVSFVTNTNWQSYSPEQTVSTLSQMAGLTVQNFLSAAAGMAVAAACARAFKAHRGEGLGNFWADMTRMVLYVLLPLSLATAIALAALGVPQSLAAHADAATLEGARQTIALYPAASQEAIKQIGTNGGGVFNANSAHPFENPNAWTNLIEIVSMNALSLACVLAFGRVVGAVKEARALAAVMVILLGAASASIYAAETATPVPAQIAAGVTDPVSMEGKEVRFGASSTAAWAAATTGASDGGVNAMHASLSPLGGGVAMFMMMLGEIIPGGVGSGLYGMAVMALLAVFVAGLMVGRTPEYLGKKVEAREIKLAMLAVLILPAAILGFTAAAAVTPAALSGLLNGGPHGLSEMLYAYASAAANNGSAFAGLSANAPWWNTTLGVAMLLGRFAYIVPVLAIAGSIAAKPRLEPTAGSLPAHGALFIGLLIGIVLILGGLQFFPALALGPIAEHFQVLGAVR